jgi:nicotinamidase-related amidase
MTSQPRRDPKADRLLTPENAALVIIDYQPTQINSIKSMDKRKLIDAIITVAKVGQVYGLPTVLSTVNVEDGRNKDTVPDLKAVLAGIPSHDRTSINAWQDQEFVDAVKATGRRKLILCALWTEACLTFPTIDAIAEGFEVYPVVDAVGGTSRTAHHYALHRCEQAGAHLISTPQLICELQRDWNRTEYLDGFLGVMFESGAFLKL